VVVVTGDAGDGGAGANGVDQAAEGAILVVLHAEGQSWPDLPPVLHPVTSGALWSFTPFGDCGCQVQGEACLSRRTYYLSREQQR